MMKKIYKIYNGECNIFLLLMVDNIIMVNIKLSTQSPTVTLSSKVTLSSIVIRMQWERGGRWETVNSEGHM